LRAIFGFTGETMKYLTGRVCRSGECCLLIDKLTVAKTYQENHGIALYKNRMYCQ